MSGEVELRRIDLEPRSGERVGVDDLDQLLFVRSNGCPTAEDNTFPCELLWVSLELQSAVSERVLLALENPGPAFPPGSHWPGLLADLAARRRLRRVGGTRGNIIWRAGPVVRRPARPVLRGALRSVLIAIVWGHRLLRLLASQVPRPVYRAAPISEHMFAEPFSAPPRRLLDLLDASTLDPVPAHRFRTDGKVKRTGPAARGATRRGRPTFRRMVMCNQGRSNPHDTEALDALRQQQRTALRSLPDFLFEEGRLKLKAPFEPPATVDDSDREFGEMAVRRVVEDQLESNAQLNEFLQRADASAWAWIRYHAIRGAANDNEPGYDTLWDLISEVTKEAESTYIGQVETDLLIELGSVVWLLRLADSLARDGYEDPRISKAVATDPK